MASQRKKQSFRERVWGMTRRIPYGKVVSYGALARVLRSPRSARAVGNALNENPYRNVPCHRVIRSDGKVGGYSKGENKKIVLLRREGIEIKNESVNLKKYRWKKILFLK